MNILDNATSIRKIYRGVSYATPQFSRTDYDRAGDALVGLPKGNFLRNEAIDKIGNWRASHAFLMESVNSHLRNVVSSIHPLGITSQRLKRLESIETKLRLKTVRRLTQMQDIGGCRAILNNVDQVRSLADEIESHELSLNNGKFSFTRSHDYIASPKEDGYRGIHLIAQYHGSDDGLNNMKIEIQARTRPQHFWATALEVCENFTGKRLKTAKKTADEKWQRYFALTSGYISFSENTPLAQNIPERIEDVVAELNTIDAEVGISVALHHWGALVKPRHSEYPAYFYVLDINGKTGHMYGHGYPKEYLKVAEEKYLSLEKETEGDVSRQIVLVSVESLNDLHDAYPNYYLDTGEFLKICRRAPYF